MKRSALILAAVTIVLVIALVSPAAAGQDVTLKGMTTCEAWYWDGATASWMQDAAGWISVTVNAHSVGAPLALTTPLGEPYDLYGAAGIVKIEGHVNMGGLPVSFKQTGRVRQLHHLWEGVEGFAIDYVLHGDTYSGYITHANVFLPSLAPILGGTHHRVLPIVSGDFDFLY